MKSPSPSPTPSQAQNTGTCPLTLIDAILHSIMSNDASAYSCQALSPPPPTMGDTPETRAVKRTRFLMILDLVMAVIEEDGEADFKRVIDEWDQTLLRRAQQCSKKGVKAIKGKLSEASPWWHAWRDHELSGAWRWELVPLGGMDGESEDRLVFFKWNNTLSCIHTKLSSYGCSHYSVHNSMKVDRLPCEFLATRVSSCKDQTQLIMQFYNSKEARQKQRGDILLTCCWCQYRRRVWYQGNGPAILNHREALFKIRCGTLWSIVGSGEYLLSLSSVVRAIYKCMVPFCT
jgi:hypothetical protein